MGRPQKPTALKILQGKPGHRKLPRGEPTPEKSVEKPKGLRPYEKEMWNYLAPRFEKQGVITENDLHAMYIMCQTWGDYREAIDEFDRQAESNGGKRLYVVSAKNGSPYPNPLLGIINTLRDRLGKQLAQFGMTPASRSSVVAVKKDEDNTWSDFGS